MYETKGYSMTKHIVLNQHACSQAVRAVKVCAKTRTFFRSRLFRTLWRLCCTFSKTNQSTLKAPKRNVRQNFVTCQKNQTFWCFQRRILSQSPLKAPEANHKFSTFWCCTNIFLQFFYCFIFSFKFFCRIFTSLFSFIVQFN